MGRPAGSYNEGSARHLIRTLLAQGRAMTLSEIIAAIGGNEKTVKNALSCGVHDKVFRSVKVDARPARYTLREYEVEVRVMPRVIASAEESRQWWQV